MNMVTIFDEAVRVGVLIDIREDGNFRVRYPKGAAADGILAALRLHKTEIIATIKEAPRLVLFVCNECGDRFWNKRDYVGDDGCPRCLGRFNLSEASFPTETAARVFLMDKNTRYDAKLYGIGGETGGEPPPLPKSVRAALDFHSRTGWEKPLPPKLAAWLENDPSIARFERQAYGEE